MLLLAAVLSLTAPQHASGPGEEAAIHLLLDDFARVVEERSLASYERLRPTLKSSDKRRLETAFGDRIVRSVEVRMTITSIEVSGTSAVVRLVRADRINGTAMRPASHTLDLVKGPAGWTIRAMGR